MSKILKFSILDETLHQKALEIRFKVFVQEQNVEASLETENELEATHFLLYHKKKPVGTARFRITENGVKLERFAILTNYRGLGLGNDLLRFVLFHARAMQKTIYLNSQHQVVGYYEKWGFIKHGAPFYEANILHFKMVYQPKDIEEKAISKAICRR